MFHTKKAGKLVSNIYGRWKRLRKIHFSFKNFSVVAVQNNSKAFFYYTGGFYLNKL